MLTGFDLLGLASSIVGFCHISYKVTNIARDLRHGPSDLTCLEREIRKLSILLATLAESTYYEQDKNCQTRINKAVNDKLGYIWIDKVYAGQQNRSERLHAIKTISLSYAFGESDCGQIGSAFNIQQRETGRDDHHLSPLRGRTILRASALKSATSMSHLSSLTWPLNHINSEDQNHSTWLSSLGANLNSIGELQDILPSDLDSPGVIQFQDLPTFIQIPQSLQTFIESGTNSTIAPAFTSLCEHDFTGHGDEGTLETTTASQNPTSKSTGSESSAAGQAPDSIHGLNADFQCRKCCRSFGRRCDLKKHVDRHDKPHICTCGKHFGSLADLGRHKRTVHQKEGLFTCGESSCARSAPGHGFQRKEHLETHLKRKGHRKDALSIDTHTPHDLTAEPSPPRKKRRIDQVHGEPEDPTDEDEVGQLKAELVDVKASCEELLDEIERLKESHEDERKILMDVIKRLTKE